MHYYNHGDNSTKFTLMLHFVVTSIKINIHTSLSPPKKLCSVGELTEVKDANFKGALPRYLATL